MKAKKLEKERVIGKLKELEKEKQNQQCRKNRKLIS